MNINIMNIIIIPIIIACRLMLAYQKMRTRGILGSSMANGMSSSGILARVTNVLYRYPTVSCLPYSENVDELPYMTIHKSFLCAGP